MTYRQGKSGRAVKPSRRGFWRSLAGEVLAIGDELRGIPQQSLRDIGTVPDAVLAEMVPTWTSERQTEIRDDGIYSSGGRAKDGLARTVKRVHSFGAYERMMVDQYACGRNLRVIAEHVARASGVDAAAAFNATRGLFVRLCKRGLCHPSAAHLSDRGDNT